MKKVAFVLILLLLTSCATPNYLTPKQIETLKSDAKWEWMHRKCHEGDE